MSKETGVDITRFYTKESGERGVPFEPVIDGEKVGITFNVLSYHAVKAAKAVERFNKEADELKKVEDVEERKRREFEANAELASSLVCGFSEGSRGPVLVDGKPLEFSKDMCYDIMLNSIPIANAVIEFSLKTRNFMGRSA